MLRIIKSHDSLLDLLKRLWDCRHLESVPGHEAIDVPDHMLAELKEVVKP